MKNTSKDDKNGWNLFQRIYAHRCKIEIRITEFIVNWFNVQENKDLANLENQLKNLLFELKAENKISIVKGPRGRYFEAPFEREFELRLSKPNRFPFIQVSEPFKNK